MDDEFFEEDEALDYVLYEEMGKNDKPDRNQNGCLVGLLIFVASSVYFGINIFI